MPWTASVKLDPHEPNSPFRQRREESLLLACPRLTQNTYMYSKNKKKPLEI